MIKGRYYKVNLKSTKPKYCKEIQLLRDVKNVEYDVLGEYYVELRRAQRPSYFKSIAYLQSAVIITETDMYPQDTSSESYYDDSSEDEATKLFRQKWTSDYFKKLKILQRYTDAQYRWLEHRRDVQDTVGITVDIPDVMHNYRPPNEFWRDEKEELYKRYIEDGIIERGQQLMEQGQEALLQTMSMLEQLKQKIKK